MSISITSELKTDKYVAFLDVLGFKEIVKKDGEKLDAYFSTITEVLDDINKTKEQIESQLISDSIILACPLYPEDLKVLLTAIQTIQVHCALENIWIRGSVSIGKIYFRKDPNIVVGDGLTKAYLLESQAKYPRVIIDPKVVGNFSDGWDLIQRFNYDGHEIKDVPLIYYPYYEGAKIENDAFFVAFAERLIFDKLDKVSKVCDSIKRGLYNDQTTYSKYLWLKKYFTEIFQKSQSVHRLMNDEVKSTVLVKAYGDFDRM